MCDFVNRRFSLVGVLAAVALVLVAMGVTFSAFGVELEAQAVYLYAVAATELEASSSPALARIYDTGEAEAPVLVIQRFVAGFAYVPPTPYRVQEFREPGEALGPYYKARYRQGRAAWLVTTREGRTFLVVKHP